MPTSSADSSSASRPDRLGVVVLCERVREGDAIARRVGAVEGADVRVLVCRNRRRPSRFAAATLMDLVRSPRLVAEVARGRLRITPRALHDERVLRRLSALRPDVGLHAMSVIYRRAAIDSFRLGLLNPHIGLLPRYRGRSVMEWSLLGGDETGITVFFIDEGIDTGSEIVLRRPVDVSAFDDVASAKRFLFGLAPEMFERALRELTRPGFRPETQQESEGTRWYAMSGLFSGVVDGLLRDG